MNTFPTNIQSGYVCGSCGQWIPYGGSHACPGITKTFTFGQAVPVLQPDRQQEIIDLLNKIISLLEKE